jgi:hypothetical protein
VGKKRQDSHLKIRMRRKFAAQQHAAIHEGHVILDSSTQVSQHTQASIEPQNPILFTEGSEGNEEFHSAAGEQTLFVIAKELCRLGAMHQEVWMKLRLAARDENKPVFVGKTLLCFWTWRSTPLDFR